MNEEDKSELAALVVGFLQQGLKDHPTGYSVEEFERVFPQVCDEPRDWYTRYKKKTTLEALECIQDAVKIHSSFGRIFIGLNLKSDKVDNHLIDLITNQKTSSKKKKGPSRPSSRALASFSLNRQYSGQYNRSNYRSRLNHGEQYRNESMFSRKVEPPSPSFRSSAYRAASTPFTDPRLRNNTSTSNTVPMVPPQVKPSSSGTTSTQRQSSSTLPLPTPKATTLVTTSAKPISKLLPSTALTPQVKPVQEKEQDPALIQKKDYLRQRLIFLLTYRHADIKILHLSALYKLEFEENLEPSYYAHSSITDLIQDPLIGSHVSVNYGSPFVTISLKKKATANGKENVASSESNHRAQSVKKYTNGECLAIQSVVLSASKQKLDAIDPFNVRSMLQNLEPLHDIKEEPPKKMEIEDGVKYKTVRIIYKEPESSLKIDQWPTKFEQESRLRMRIEDYGFVSLLDFFKKLSTDAPIDIRLKNDEWIASIDMSRLSEWMYEQMAKQKYRAIIALEARYELIAFPNDTYTFTEQKDIAQEGQNYLPAFILSVKRSNSMWIQLRTPKRIETHLCVETSMSGYKDYQENRLLTVPKAFVKPGFPCAVYDSSQQRWCRALVLKAPEVIDKNYEITALLVDYGAVKNYAISQLSCIMRTHLKQPVGPIFARLHGVNNENSINVQKRSKQILQEYTCPPVTLACKFIQAKPSNEPPYMPKDIFDITLVDTRQERDCNLADDCNYQKEDD